MSFLTLNKLNISVLILICFLVLIVPDLLLAETPADAEKVDSSFIERILWSIVNGLFGVLVWLSGMLLNTAVTDYVVGFGNKSAFVQREINDFIVIRRNTVGFCPTIIFAFIN